MRQGWGCRYGTRIRYHEKQLCEWSKRIELHASFKSSTVTVSKVTKGGLLKVIQILGSGMVRVSPCALEIEMHSRSVPGIMLEIV